MMMSVGDMRRSSSGKSAASSSLSLRIPEDSGSPPNSPPNRINKSPEKSPNFWHKTSFKIGKSKPSKTRYLTRKELFGLGMSVVVSCILSMTMLAILYYGTPVLADKLLFFFNFSTSNRHEVQSGTLQQVKPTGVAIARKVIKVYNNLSPENFKENYLSKNIPLLFTLQEDSKSGLCLEDVVTRLDAFDADEIIQLLPMSGFGTLSPETLHGSKSTPLKTYMTSSDKIDVRTCCFLISDSHLAKKLDLSLRSLIKAESEIYLSVFNEQPRIVISRNDERLCGSPFHAHKQTLHYLVQGKKHWVVFKQDSVPPGGFNPQYNLRQWLKSYNNITHQVDNVFHIFQEEGQFVYIPEGWYHATDTQADLSVGISFPSTSTSSTSYFHYMIEGYERIKSNDVQGGIRLFKLGLGINRNIQLLEHLADALIKDHSYTAAEDVLREMLQYNPQNPTIYSQLISMMINHANKDVSESISELLDQAERYGLREHVLTLSQESL